MRNNPEPDGMSSSHHHHHHHRKVLEKKYRQRNNNPSFEDSVGYRLATEGSASYSNDMGANGTLQIWPQVSSQTYQKLPDAGQRLPYHRTINDAVNQRSREDVSTLHSYQDSLRRQPAVSQQPSMASMRDMPRKAFHTLHASSSQPNFHTYIPEIKRRVEVPPSPKSSRSQRLGLSKIFGKDKEAKQSKNRFESRIEERVKKDNELYHIKAHVKPAELQPQPQPSTINQRSQKTVFDRNQTENAKINVRRPPKGIKHWFDGLDDSDEDLPEVVQTSPEPVTTATFRPSLGPSRLRAAPTSCISPSIEPSQDYFRFKAPSEAPRKPSNATGANLQDQSMLNLDSSDEEELSEPPSPGRWPEQSLELPRSNYLQPTKSNERRGSAFSMQTMMTSGSIPIINADEFFRTPLPPLPVPQQYTRDPAMPAPLRTKSSEMITTRNRSATGQSIPDSTRSGVSAMTTGTTGTNGTSSTTHVMTVTQDEMVLLEMMRRKRAEMHTGPGPQHPAHRHEPPRPRGFERQNSTSKSIASSTLSRDSDRSVLGNIFPAPPTRSVSGRELLSDRRYHNQDEKGLAHVEEETPQVYERKLSATPQASDVRSPVFYELEAPVTPLEHLPAVCYSRPTPKCQPSPSPLLSPTSQKTTTTTTTTTRSKLGLPPPPYDSADPYQLAPDLDFSPLDLLPLSARTYSPSLSTKRSSEGAASQFSAAMTDSASTNTSAGTASGSGGKGGVVGNEAEICELDVKRNSSKPPVSVQMAGSDVLAAWGALGGI